MSNKEVRRMRGEIACAECRRLKIRCDRTVPCSTCVKRGCGALCPVGTIPPGEGSRFVLAATEHLETKLYNMEARMHALEDAVAILQASDTNKKHPLLASPFFFEEEDDSSNLKLIPEAVEQPKNPVGTLHMDSEGGPSRFFGPGGGSESVLLKSKDMQAALSSSISPSIEELDFSYLPTEINICARAFPFSPPQDISPNNAQVLIEMFLPRKDRAVRLCELYLEHLSWMARIISKQEILVELLPIIFKEISGSYSPHDLSLLLVVLGIGALLDPSLPPYNLEAQHYYRLAQAALVLQRIMAERSVTTIKALHLMSIYNGMSGKESNMELSYTLLNLAGQTASRIAFHFDPSLWGFTGKEAYERRVYFWSLLQGIVWQSLVTGRPPSISIDHIECQIPSAEDEEAFQQGEVPQGFGRWGFQSMPALLIPIAKAILAVKPPEYTEILELDKKIQDFMPPESDSKDTPCTAASMSSWVRSHYRFLMLLFLHRGYFAEVMLETPFDPFHSPYRQSFLSAYKGACFVVQDTEEQFARQPVVCGRIWRIWSFAFSASMVIGTVAARAGHVTGLDPPPLAQFKKTCQLFQSAAETSSRAARALPVLLTMLEKASRSYHELHPEPTAIAEDHEEVLSLFSGFKNLVASLPSSWQSSPFPTHPSPQPPSVPPVSQPQLAFLNSISYNTAPSASPGSFSFDLHGTDYLTNMIPSLPELPDELGTLDFGQDPFFDRSDDAPPGAMLDNRWMSLMDEFGVFTHSQPYTVASIL